MKLRLIFERTVLILSVFILAGTNRCREDYFFATQSEIAVPTGTGTVSGTSSPTVTGTIRTSTPTATSEADETLGPDETAEPDGTGTATPTVTATATPTTRATSGLVLGRSGGADAEKNSEAKAAGLLSELATLDKPEQISGTGTPNAAGQSIRGSADAMSGKLDSNWLGTIYDDSKDSDGSDREQGRKQFSGNDSDKDGYVDELEVLERSDPNASNSFPDWIKSTSLSQRLRGSDDDGDGVANDEERTQGTDPLKEDSDGDGVPDGAERLSGSNPLSSQSMPVDGDKDGLSDDFERAQGSNEYSSDSDGDGANDASEAALGTNPIARDSDLDGITDGREIQSDGDPLNPDIK